MDWGLCPGRGPEGDVCGGSRGGHNVGGEEEEERNGTRRASHFGREENFSGEMPEGQNQEANQFGYGVLCLMSCRVCLIIWVFLILYD